jgi:hypothetical protein
MRQKPVSPTSVTGLRPISAQRTPTGDGPWKIRCGTLAVVVATVSFFYGFRDPVTVTAG